MLLAIETMNKVKILFNSSRSVTTPALTEILERAKMNVYKIYFNKHNKLFVLCNSSDDLDTYFLLIASQSWRQWGSNPFCLLISKQKDQSYISDVMSRYLIKEKKILKIKSRSKMTVKVQEIFKYNSSKNIKVTFDSQHMASLVLTKGLLLFNLSHPARNICKEIFVEILICFKCYQLEDHPTSSCPKSKDYKIGSLCASLEHTHRECTSSTRKCIKCEEGNDHSTLALS